MDGRSQKEIFTWRQRMAAKQSPGQRKTAGRVMHEFAHGELRSGGGDKVKTRRQAIAIALKEAGASKYATKSENKRNLARSERKLGARRRRAA
jgi:hypothetical protein